MPPLYTIVTPVLLFVSFLLVLLVSLSVPIIHTISLFDINGYAGVSFLNTGVSLTGHVSFGVWGYCISAVDVDVVGIDSSGGAQCSKPSLGFDFDADVANALHVQVPPGDIQGSLTKALVLHPIACGLIFLALIASLFVVRWRPSYEILRVGSTVARITTGLATITTTTVFITDVTTVVLTREKLNSDADGLLHVVFGNAVWMMLGATIGLTAATIYLTVGLCMQRRRYRALQSPEPSQTVERY